jgi:hypothetical protein
MNRVTVCGRSFEDAVREECRHGRLKARATLDSGIRCLSVGVNPIFETG